MTDELKRTMVTFRSNRFNTTEPRPYFINPECYGDDVARWLIQALAAQGVPVDEEPGQEDFGWYFGFQVDGVDYHLVLGYQDGDGDEEGQWIGWLERRVGFVASLLGRRSHGLQPAAARVIHAVLTADPEIRNIRWHERKAFEAGREDEGSHEP